MHVLLLDDDNLLGQCLIQHGLLENITFYTSKPSEYEGDGLKVLFDKVKPDCVINLAFYFDWFQARHVDLLRLQQQVSFVDTLACLCKDSGAILFQPSSYRVFGGQKVTAYTEEDDPFPISSLGRTLWQVENIVRTRCDKYIILRLGWVVDFSAEGKVGRILAQAEDIKACFLADDRRGNPTPVDDAARVILGVLQQLDCGMRQWGTYHYGGSEATTALSFGQSVIAEARHYQPDLATDIQGKTYTKFPDAEVEPQHAVLSCKAILHAFGIKQRPWCTEVSALIKRFYQYK